MARGVSKRSAKPKARSKSRSAKATASSTKKPSKSSGKNRRRDSQGSAKSVTKATLPKASKSVPKLSLPEGSKSRTAHSSKVADETKQIQKAGLPPATNIFEPADIIDAPEFHDEARAMGILTTGTWDDDRRSFEDRRADFLFAYPPTEPARNLGGRLQRQDDRSFAPGDERARLDRFMSQTWGLGTIHEVLSRFGLKMKNAPPYEGHLVRLDPLRDVAKRRNVRLRVLHGGVDVEPVNMDAAKAEFLDRQEKEQAARDIRLARQRMAVKRDENLP